MKRERYRKKILLHMVLIVALSIFAVLFFLFSIKGLLLSEAEDNLLAYNQTQVTELDQGGTWKQNTNEFEGQIYSFLMDDSGNIVDAYGDRAKEIAKRNSNNLSIVLQDKETAAYRIQLQENNGLVEKHKLLSGESYYFAVHIAEVIENGYVISLVPASVIDDEIVGIWRIVLAIVILASISILFGLIYSVYKKRTFYRRMSKKGKPDPVTGLSHYLVHKLRAQQLINAEKNIYAYVSFSIDKYNLISELSSKSYCDCLLKTLADGLKGWIKEDETLARVHDDLFGMLLKYDDEIKFRQRLTRMFKYAGDIPITENNFCNITFHSGVCLVGRETDIDKVIARARKARKHSGVNSIASINFYQSSKAAHKNNDLIVNDAKEALEEKRFYVYLQPKYRLESEKIAGAEALVRWNHETYGLLSPNVFLPLLEETEMITQIDYFVLESVCDMIRGWIQEGKQAVPVSINLSVKHLLNPLFVQEILDIVDQHQVPHELIEFEFPETAVYDMKQELLDVMKQLHVLGFILSIDNFGAGALAVHLLKELPIHILKLDKGLIRDYEESEYTNKDRTIVTHIISYAKSMNMKVLAEGVETMEQKEILREESCDMIQGFYYQKPMPLQEFEKLLEA